MELWNCDSKLKTLAFYKWTSILLTSGVGGGCKLGNLEMENEEPKAGIWITQNTWDGWSYTQKRGNFGNSGGGK